MEDPWALLRRLKTGREEFCQRLLTMLILEDYPRWNTRSKPSARGLAFLRELDDLSFGTADLADEVDFVDELELPARHDGERGRAPDYGVLGLSRVWLIELKTEAASHRADQIPDYFDFARHHFPEQQVDITYVSPPYRGATLHAPQGSKFAHVTWDDVLPLVRKNWDRAGAEAGRIVDALTQVLEENEGPWGEWWQTRTEDAVASGVRLAARTTADGKQRALDHQFGSLDELEAVRVALRDELAAAG